MSCPKCKKDDPSGREMCPYCGAPVKPIPVPPGGKIRFGKYDWYILDRRCQADKQGDRILVITEKVIEKRPYHSKECEITWESSDMRKYLNGEFYNSFSKSDRSRIIEVINENNDNPWYGTSGGNPTTDKIFLLSIEEVVKYFGDSGQLKNRFKNPGWDWCKDEYLPWICGEYDLAQRAVDDNGIVSHWRLRSPGSNNGCVAFVMGFCGDGFDQGGIEVSGGSDMKDGHFIFDGPGALSNLNPFYKNLNGVRPALWLKNNEKWLQWAVEIQSIAQAGLTYGKDRFDIERYERLREISAEMISLKAEIPVDTVKDLFCNENGYQTPKLDTRAAIFKDGKILLVKENNGKWSLPGGWVDVNVSVKENTVKEVKEESGLDVTADRIIAVQDRAKHNLPVYAYGICKIFVLCSVVGGEFEKNIETTKSDYFGEDDLPELASEKSNEDQIKMCFEAYRSEEWVTLFD